MENLSLEIDTLLSSIYLESSININKCKLSDATDCLNILNKHVKKIQNIIDLKTISTDDISFVYKSGNVLKYNDDNVSADDVDDIADKLQPSSYSSIIKQPTITKSKILIDELNTFVGFEKTNSLDDVGEMFKFYHDDNSKTPSGIYCSINSVKVRLRFPTIIDPNSICKDRTITCMYITKEKCESNNEYKKIRNFKCKFSHVGDKINIVGNISKCTKKCSIGNYDTLMTDLKLLNINDIKKILYYGLSDVFTAYMWFERQSNLKHKPTRFPVSDRYNVDNSSFMKNINQKVMSDIDITS